MEVRVLSSALSFLSESYVDPKSIGERRCSIERRPSDVCRTINWAIFKFKITRLETEETITVKSRWEILMKGYNRARDEKSGLPFDGRIFLRYPQLFINDTPFKLDQATIDQDHKNVIVLRDGTKPHLYQGDVEPTFVQQAPEPKPKPSWNIKMQRHAHQAEICARAALGATAPAPTRSVRQMPQ